MESHLVDIRKDFEGLKEFFNADRQVVAYSAETNFCQYVVAMLQRFGLQDKDLRYS